MVYTHVLNRGGRGVHSPLDRLRKAVSSESGGIFRTDRIGLKLGGQLLNIKEVVIIKAVAAPVRRRRFRVRPTRTGLIQVSLNRS